MDQVQVGMQEDYTEEYCCFKISFVIFIDFTIT